MGDIPAIKVGTGWVEVEVVSEVDVLLTFRGYAPVLQVKIEKSGLIKFLYIGAKSLAVRLAEFRTQNGGRFVGLKLRVRKQSDDSIAAYEVERL
jgi:hypothetical protein